MASCAPTPTLSTLPWIAYLTPAGEIPLTHQKQVGIYAIFDEGQTLQYVGYSRDVYQSLKQHLIRQPQACYWYKVQTIERPSRTVLDNIRTAWLAEQGMPPGNQNEAVWAGPIDVKATLSEAERADYSALDDLAQVKYLKTVARRHEAIILQQLADRGVTMSLRFNPKLKEAGLLDLKG
jgi:hypothetical protein